MTWEAAMLVIFGFFLVGYAFALTADFVDRLKDRIERLEARIEDD